ncbi:DUF4325 domain-containing protein [Candidatus Methylospira mobilis]|uniref:DUF4325 domain-containing protein n=1 Tax=Candidatus Methylospira mobilis TaxID=1808979 RepID=A0A5Q0BLI2_9GAMM|nr:DUF4325 domain-containing protein [Candidatus Methylospira mobilis]
MEEIILSPIGTDLASRRSAGHLRQQITSNLACDKKVVFDLSSVETISESYADELFGVLAYELGLNDFVLSISFKGARPSVLFRIAESIKKRLEQQNLQDTIHDLVVARHAGTRKFSRIGA